MTTQTEPLTAWHCVPADDVAGLLGTDASTGLTSIEAAERLAEHGPNSIPKEQPPSTWMIALKQIREPMNVMLIVVTVLSVLIGQVSTAILVGVLVALNVWMSTSQALKARESADAQATELAQRISRESLTDREAFNQLAEADPQRVGDAGTSQHLADN